WVRPLRPGVAAAPPGRTAAPPAASFGLSRREQDLRLAAQEPQVLPGRIVGQGDAIVVVDLRARRREILDGRRPALLHEQYVHAVTHHDRRGNLPAPRFVATW